MVWKLVGVRRASVLVLPVLVLGACAEATVTPKPVGPGGSGRTSGGPNTPGSTQVDGNPQTGQHTFQCHAGALITPTQAPTGSLNYTAKGENGELVPHWAEMSMPISINGNPAGTLHVEMWPGYGILADEIDYAIVDDIMVGRSFDLSQESPSHFECGVCVYITQGDGEIAYAANQGTLRIEHLQEGFFEVSVTNLQFGEVEYDQFVESETCSPRLPQTTLQSPAPRTNR